MSRAERLYTIVIALVLVVIVCTRVAMATQGYTIRVDLEPGETLWLTCPKSLQLLALTEDETGALVRCPGPAPTPQRSWRGTEG